MSSEEYSELISNKKDFITFFGKRCYEKLLFNKIFKDLISKFHCQEFKKEALCLTFMFMLKACVIADHASHKSLGDMTSQELAASFVKMFIGLDNLTKESFAKNTKLVDALLEMHPND